MDDNNKINCAAIFLGLGFVALIIRVDAILSSSKEQVAWTQSQVTCSRFDMTVTAYCPCELCCGNYTDGCAASGHVIKPGDRFVAADKRYPFGTQFIIPGYNNDQPVTVLDRGSAITGNRLDVFFDSHSQAIEWGVRELMVREITQR